jgi:uncharacterized membrane protein YcaP (DUF421 family)
MMETVIRVTVVYLFLMLGLRVLGKREFGQLSPLELVSLLLIPELVSNALQSEDFSLVDALVAVSTLLALTVLTSMLLHMNKTAQRVIDGEPAVLVAHGQLAVDAMNRERVTTDEIFSEMHKSGLECLEQVAWAILETEGTITIVPENPDDRDKRGQGRENAVSG